MKTSIDKLLARGSYSEILLHCKFQVLLGS